MIKIKSLNIRFFNALLLLLSIGFASCEKGDPTDCFKSTGEEITETRTVSFFNKIVLEDNVNLVLTQSNEYALSVRGGKNVLKKLKTDVENGVLNIKNNNSCNWMRSFERELTVFVNVDSLNQIEYRGSGDINCTNAITGDSLLLDIWEGAGTIDMQVDVRRNFVYFHIGTANVYYSGNAHLSYLTASSFGPIHAESLKSVFTFINNEGSNNCYINTQLRLEATIKNIGNIYYTGHPEILLNNSGSGELINNN